MTSYQLLVAAHASIGTLALITFWSAALVRKGGALHRRIGQAYLLAMTGILVTGLPMAVVQFARGNAMAAAFLAYLLVITATGVWSAWRAIRDKHDVVRFTGPVYVALAWLSLLSGVGVLALGVHVASPLFAGFSVVGVFAGLTMLRKRRQRAQLAAQTRWWLVQHYTAMLGNGVATHIAFLGIGLPRLLPAINGTALHYVAWFGPLVVAALVKAWLDRRWKPRAAGTMTSAIRTAAG